MPQGQEGDISGHCGVSLYCTPAAVYRPRNPQFSDYYRCVEDLFETFVQVYEERFERPYGFWRPYLKKVIDRYLECGDLHHGFARVKCPDCHHEYLLAFSCKGMGLGMGSGLGI